MRTKIALLVISFSLLAGCSWLSTEPPKSAEETRRERDERIRENAAKIAERTGPAMEKAGEKMRQAAKTAMRDVKAAAEGVKEGLERDRRTRIEEAKPGRGTKQDPAQPPAVARDSRRADREPETQR